jgi:saxitoxin biosynthesis operon SxtJ-like protein
MAEGIPARLSPGEGRRFGRVVGIAFLVVAAVAFWRGRILPAQIFAGVGAALVLLGLVLPAALLPVQRVWMGLALAISKVTTPIFLGIVYFGVIAPIGLVRRLGGENLARRARGKASFWVSRQPGHEKNDMERQF